MDILDNSHMARIIDYLATNTEAVFKASKYGREGWLLTIKTPEFPDYNFTGHTFSEAIRKTSEWVFMYSS